VLITVNDYDKGSALKLARDLQRMGFTLYATAGTGAFFERRPAGHDPGEGAAASSPATPRSTRMRDGKVQLIINTPLGPNAREDGARFGALPRAWKFR
jgi:carbamoyl-phosphate synthase large subunit